MKITLCRLGVIAFFSANTLLANDAVQVYGLVNKELRTVTQDDDVQKSNGDPAVTDVDGFESRLGAKGKLMGGAHDVSYVIELGINSAKDAGDASRIRIRLAKTDIDLGFGLLTVGQDWTRSSKFYISSDPLVYTFAQNSNLNTSYVQGQMPFSTLKGLGYSFRPFREQIRYTTPSMAGVTYSMGYETTPPGTFVNPARAIEHFVQYKSDMIEAGVLYALCKTCKKDEKKPDIGVGVKAKFSGMMVAANYGSQVVAYDAEGKESKLNRLFLSWSLHTSSMFYGVTVGQVTADGAVSGTYGSTTAEDGTVTPQTVDYDGSTQMQAAVGVGYKIHPKAMLKLTLGNASIETDKFELAAGKKKNAASIAAAGFQVAF